MKGLLKILTCGSVDDGKSTLIGHLLYDAQLLYTDQKTALEAESAVSGRTGIPDYSLLLDGLLAEREQGITIDVAYRYFQTKNRAFIVADAPGHEEYTRNMAVGASFAELAILLIDATKGVRLQTKRHFRICRLMGIRHYVFAVNKMDLVSYREDVFRTICQDLTTLTTDLSTDNVTMIPVSAKEGDHLLASSPNMPWYNGPSLLSFLEQVDVDVRMEEGSLLPIQRVSFASGKGRHYEGTISCGSISTGDVVEVLPQGVRTTVSSLLRAGSLASLAHAGDAVSLSLSEEIDISRGSVLVKDTSLMKTGKFEAMLLWLDDTSLVEGRSYRLKLATQQCSVSVMQIKYIEDIDTARHLSGRILKKNGLACVDIACAEELLLAPFSEHPELGRFLLIDKLTCKTAACGVVLFSLRRAHTLFPQTFAIDRISRAASLRQSPKTIWFTGLSGAGKSALANALEQRLALEGKHTMLLDGDNIRLGLNKDLGFNSADRIENIRRVAEVAKLMNEAGLIVLVSFISPFAADRQTAREIIGTENFVEVYVNTSIEECERRDTKGLYKKARAGEIPNFTGIGSPYEIPEHPEIIVETQGRTVGESAEHLWDDLQTYIESL